MSIASSSPRRVTRRSRVVALAAALWSSAALLSACNTAAPGPAVVDSRLLSGWESNARPLLPRAPMHNAGGTTAWTVPATLPRGTYEVISRRGGGAQLIDGRRFEVDGQAYKELVLVLPSTETAVEVVEARFVNSAAKR